jgi:hypothetical protein
MGRLSETGKNGVAVGVMGIIEIDKRRLGHLVEMGHLVLLKDFENGCEPREVVF